MPNYILNSTKRIAQLTGDYDPEPNVAHYNYTQKWGCSGTDLGANTVHDDATFIFFGDVITPEEHNDLKDKDMMAFIDHHLLMPGAGIASSHQVDNNLLDVVTVDEHGRLYVSFVVKKGIWQGPVRISAKHAAAPGSVIATAHQVSKNVLNVFFTGPQGGLYVTWVVGTGMWQEKAFQIASPDMVPAGAYIAADHQVDDNVLNVFFINSGGHLSTCWVVGTGNWQGPIHLGGQVASKPGAPVATAHQVDNNVLNVFFTGIDGGLYMTWVVGRGYWQENPIMIGSPDLVPAGAHIATDHQVDNNTLNVFFIGKNGGLYVCWVVGRGEWQKPVLISSKGIALPGSPVKTDHQVDQNMLNVFFTGKNGGLYTTWVVGNGAWQKKAVLLGSSSIVPAAAHITTNHQVDNNTLNVFFVGKDRNLYVTWVEGLEKWKKPLAISPAFQLTPILKGNRFYPFSYFHDSALLNRRDIPLPINSTPSGAFSFDNKMYVFFFHSMSETQYFSALGVSDNPFAPKAYKFLGQLSNKEKNKFFQVAPCVISNKEFRQYLPQNVDFPGDGGDGLILLGQGGANGIHLAWMPLHKGLEPDLRNIHYYTGNGSNWSTNQYDTKSILQTKYYWSSISIGRIPTTGHWILLYQHAGGANRPPLYPKIWDESRDAPIMARVAATPWALENATDLKIFDPKREKAIGRYMDRAPESTVKLYQSGIEIEGADNRKRFLPDFDHPSFAYGPYILNQYTQYDEQTKIATIYYLMSTGRPYQVQVMRSKIQL